MTISSNTKTRNYIAHHQNVTQYTDLKEYSEVLKSIRLFVPHWLQDDVIGDLDRLINRVKGNNNANNS